MQHARSPLSDSIPPKHQDRLSQSNSQLLQVLYNSGTRLHLGDSLMIRIDSNHIDLHFVSATRVFSCALDHLFHHAHVTPNTFTQQNKQVNGSLGPKGALPCSPPPNTCLGSQTPKASCIKETESRGNFIFKIKSSLLNDKLTASQNSSFENIWRKVTCPLKLVTNLSLISMGFGSPHQLCYITGLSWSLVWHSTSYSDNKDTESYLVCK